MKEYCIYIKGRIYINAKNKEEALDRAYETISDIESDNDDIDVEEIVEI